MLAQPTEIRDKHFFWATQVQMWEIKTLEPSTIKGIKPEGL